MFDTLKLIYTQDEAFELVSRYEEAYKEKIKELEERIRFLEQCLDNKEKVNKSMRDEIEELNKMMLFETELEK